MSLAFPARYAASSRVYGVDWTADLEDGEHITAAFVDVVDGDMTVSGVGFTPEGMVRFRLSGGTATKQVQRVAIRYVTSASPPNSDKLVASITILG